MNNLTLGWWMLPAYFAPVCLIVAALDFAWDSKPVLSLISLLAAIALTSLATLAKVL